MNKNNSFLDALEKHFNPRESVPDYKKFLNKSFQNSKNANLILEGHRDIKYGNGSLQNLDIFGNKKAYKSAAMRQLAITIASCYHNVYITTCCE